MKAILEFDLDEGQDKMAHLRCVKALNMAIVLWDMDQYLRGLIKYGELDDAIHKTLEDTRGKLREIMSENSIDLDELIN
jgi:hypothetical protein